MKCFEQKLCLLIILLCFFNCKNKLEEPVEQKEITIPPNRIATKLDSVINIKQLTEIEKNIDKIYYIDPFSFGPRTESVILIETFNNMKDSLKIHKPFQKGDFDRNSYTDILIATEDFLSRGSKVIMNYKDSIQIHELSWINQNDFTLSKKRNDSVIDLYYEDNLSYYNPEYPKNDKILKKSLTYKFGGFIEFNPNPKKYNIEKIEVGTSGCFGSCPIFRLILESQKPSIFIAKNHNFKKDYVVRKDYNDTKKELKGEFKANLDPVIWNNLVEQLNYMDFPNLKEHYAVTWSDDQAINLTITYNNGKVKSIHDYGQVGSYGLINIYKVFYNLRFNQNWEEIR